MRILLVGAAVLLDIGIRQVDQPVDLLGGEEAPDLRFGLTWITAFW